MNIDSRLFHGRYLVTRYPRGPKSVRDNETDKSMDFVVDKDFPYSPEAFAELFKDADNA